MRPFQQFRLWARRAPVAERGVAAVIAAIVLTGLVALAVVPPEDDDDTIAAGGVPGEAASLAGPSVTGGAGDGGPAVQGADAGTGTASAAGASSSRRTVSSGGGGVAAGSAAGGPGGCVSPPGSDQGITDKEVRIALMLVELVGATGNETVNVPSKEAQKADYDAMVDEINKTGGVACRKLTPVYFTINPLDQAQLQQTCLEVAEAKVFYANDLGGYAAFPGIADCYIQHQIPFYEGNFIPQAQLERAYPYMFAAGTQDNVYFNAAFALKELGFFDPAKGFKKLGYFYQDCIPEHPQKYLKWLQQASGLSSSQIVTYTFGCPVGLYAPPSDIAAAVLQFQQAGVTHVTHVRGEGDWYNFTRAAQQQGFKPKYGWGDQSASFSSYGTLSPDWRNADGAILITDYRFNEERTAGLGPTAGTERCAKIMAAHGQPHPYKQQIGMSGVACNQLWFFASAINHAPELKRTALAQGLLRGGEIDFSYPHGPATFPTQKSTYHGNFWRPLVAHANCSCWQVADATFRPTFPGFQ